MEVIDGPKDMEGWLVTVGYMEGGSEASTGVAVVGIGVEFGAGVGDGVMVREHEKPFPL